MSGHNKAPDISGSILKHDELDEQVYLTDLSPSDQPWDKHRRNADIVSGYFRQGGMIRYAERVDLCSRKLDFKLVPDSKKGTMKLKLTDARFCRVRQCTICQWRRSLVWKAKAYSALPKVLIDYPAYEYRWMFLTLTVKNCHITELKDTLHHVNESFRRLTQLKAFPGIGYIKSVEVTRGRDGVSAHPHLHCLILLKDTYFKQNYLSKSDWIKLWKQCLRVDYSPILDVKAIKPESSPVGLIAEILKYQCKESDLVADPDWFCQYVKQVHGTRAVSVGGVLREALYRFRGSDNWMAYKGV
jgi:plasmid rolling circle replication initiator protein Rep